MIISYWLAAICLGVIASGFIIGPLIIKPMFLKRKQREDQEPEEGGIDREHINVGLFEERLSELNSQRQEGEISEDEFAEMQLELQKNLLVDTNGTSSIQPTSVAAGRLPLVLAVLIPLFAIFAYSEFGLNWGSISDVEIAGELKGGGAHDPARMSETVKKLARSMEQQPDNHEGWFMLGQLYHGQSEFEKAAEVFKRLSLVYIGDSGLASYYAESLFLADNRNITPRVDDAIKKALALNPHDLTMLEIRGMDAFQKGEFSAAQRYFTTALSIAKGPRAKLIQQAIDRLENQTGVTGTSAKPPISTATVTQSIEASPQGTRLIEVLVEIDSQIDVKANSSVFVFAKAVTGPPMPLAVQKLMVTDLPQLIKLDESMAMMQGMGLANFDLVEVVARISSSGIANASPDDFEAKSGQIDLTRATSVIKLTIKNKIRDQ